MNRLYPWLGRGPREAREMAERFFRRDLDVDAPLFSHLPRFRSAMSLKRLFSRELAEALRGVDALADLTRQLPREFQRFSPLARAQYLEMHTLLSGYILSAQGDRASMAHSVEGRYPFLDREVVECASRMPDAHKLHVLDEKHVLKRLASRLVPHPITKRPKQPYRAPDALSFFGRGSPVIDELLAEPLVREANLFDPAGVSRLVAKCRRADGQGAVLTNADNMALVGVLSTQALWHELVKKPPRRVQPSSLHVIDRSAR
jgi:asparagine synthase (glutamine-hydrolysing)